MASQPIKPWQDWHSKDFKEFLNIFYIDQLKLARSIASNNKVKGEPFYADDLQVMLAVFNKIAPPAIYIEQNFKTYLSWKKQEIKKENVVLATELQKETLRNLGITDFAEDISKDEATRWIDRATGTDRRWP